MSYCKIDPAFRAKLDEAKQRVKEAATLAMSIEMMWAERQAKETKRWNDRGVASVITIRDKAEMKWDVTGAAQDGIQGYVVGGTLKGARKTFNARRRKVYKNGKLLSSESVTYSPPPATVPPKDVIRGVLTMTSSDATWVQYLETHGTRRDDGNYIAKGFPIVAEVMFKNWQQMKQRMAQILEEELEHLW